MIGFKILLRNTNDTVSMYFYWNWPIIVQFTTTIFFLSFNKKMQARLKQTISTYFLLNLKHGVSRVCLHVIMEEWVYGW